MLEIVGILDGSVGASSGSRELKRIITGNIGIHYEESLL